jgi:hypothetical protein
MKTLVTVLSGLALVVLLYGLILPQYGDGAIGTILVYAGSLALYLAALAIALPLAVRAYRRKETLVQSATLCLAIAAPLIVWLFAMWRVG